MSHVTTLDLHIKDLDALAKACEAIGLEFVQGKTHYKWYGRHMGDYPCPAGFTPSDLGKCSHVLRIKGRNAYEVGVVPRRDGKPGYTLLWDFWQGGYGLEEAVGKGYIDPLKPHPVESGWKLKDQYGAQIAVKEMKKKGFSTTIKTTVKGLRVVATK